MNLDVKDIKLKKVKFKYFLSKGKSFYKVLNNYNERLALWFSRTDEKLTPNLARTFIFMMLYVLDITNKKMLDYLSGNKLYIKKPSGNDKSENLLKRNDYRIETVTPDVPTSPRNPKVTTLTQWQKIR